MDTSEVEDKNESKGHEAVKQKVDPETVKKARETSQVEEAVNIQEVQLGEQQLRVFLKV
jgi:hypothetical protein